MGRDDAGRSRERRQERSRSRDRDKTEASRGSRKTSGQDKDSNKASRDGKQLKDAKESKETKEAKEADGLKKTKKTSHKDERREVQKESQKESRKESQKEGKTTDGSKSKKDERREDQKESQKETRKESQKEGKKTDGKSKKDNHHDVKESRKSLKKESGKDSKEDRSRRRDSPRSNHERESPRKNGEEQKQPRREVCTARENDSSLPSRARSGDSCSRSADSQRGKRKRSGSSGSRSQDQRRRSTDNGGVRDDAASGFGYQEAVPDSLLPEAVAAPLPEKVQGLLDNRDSLFQDVLKLKQSLEDAHEKPSQPPPAPRPKPKEENKETAIKMPSKLAESLLHPSNESRLLARTGLEKATLSQDGLVLLRAHSVQGLSKALSQLRRIAYHCQWGVSQAKVAALLLDKPAKPTCTMLVRLAATSSQLRSHEARMTSKDNKLRLGKQAGAGSLVIDGIPGISRRHCTITFESEKSACYVQDLSTNGMHLNGKKLPRPPYKNPQDARVRLFHGDELLFRQKDVSSWNTAEELGFVVNIIELS